MRTIATRLAAGFATLLVTSMVVFAVTAVMPGDAARMLLGRDAADAAVEAKRTALGLDEPLARQYLSWLGGFLTGDWGTSFASGLPVRDTVLDAFGRSLVLAGVTLAVLIPLAVGLGLVAGMRPGSLLDRTISIVATAGTATPEFVSGPVLLIVFSVRLGWFPPSARSEHGLRGLVLPVTCLLIVMVGYISKMVRAQVISTMEQPFVQTARVKGIGTTQLVCRHVLRNSVVVPLSVLGVHVRYLLAGLVTVELLFSYPGVGSVIVGAASAKDVPLLQAAAMLTGVAVLVAFLLTDVLSSRLDPRLELATRI